MMTGHSLVSQLLKTVRWIAAVVLTGALMSCGGIKPPVSKPAAVPPIPTSPAVPQSPSETPAVRLSTAPQLTASSSTKRELTITVAATATVNPNATGRASPISLRLFELQSLSRFNRLDFFSLQDDDGASLNGELLSNRIVIVRPGSTSSIRVNLGSSARYLGVIGAFRSIDSARWRAVYQLTDSVAQAVTVTANGLTVSITAQDKQ